MAEHRAIKSTIWDDTWFGRLSPFEMNVWIGLFSKCADDQGRLQDDAALIRSKLFPYQDVAIQTVEDALQKFNNGHLMRYEKGEHLAQLVRWFDNQPMQYAVPSNYPPPDGWIDRYRTNYKRINIVWNWNEMESTEIGILLWNGLSVLQRPSSWTSYLGRLNYNPNPIINPNPNPLNKGNNRVDTAQSAPSEPFTIIQHAIERTTGIMPDGSAIKAINELVTMGAVEEDIKAGYGWLVDNGKQFRYYSQIIGPARTAMAKRIQGSNGHDREEPQARPIGTVHITLPGGQIVEAKQ